jgi:small-conductance mechanosensitive channel
MKTMPATVLQQGIPTSPDGVIDRYGPALVDIAATVVLFVVAFVLIYYSARAALVRLTEGALSARGFDGMVVDLGSSIAGVIALFAALGLAATIAGFGTVLAAFATLLGALSLALGFAAQDLIGNFVAGVFISRDEPFEVGDWIEWNDTTGVVREIELRVTKLETFDNELITVPNSELADNAVTNPVANDELRVPFTFGIGYEDDIEQAKEIIVEEAATVDRFEAEPEPDVILTELGGSSVNLTARAHIADPSRGKYVNAVSTWVQGVKERFDAEGIDMPYPYTELTGGIDIENMGEADLARADD